MNRQKGFSIIEIVIAVAIIAIIGLIGWRVWDANYRQDNATDTPAATQQSEIKTTEDLDKANASLDGADIDSTYEQQLDAETNF